MRIALPELKIAPEPAPPIPPRPPSVPRLPYGQNPRILPPPPTPPCPPTVMFEVTKLLWICSRPELKTAPPVASPPVPPTPAGKPGWPAPALPPTTLFPANVQFDIGSEPCTACPL